MGIMAIRTSLVGKVRDDIFICLYRMYYVRTYEGSNVKI